MNICRVILVPSAVLLLAACSPSVQQGPEPVIGEAQRERSEVPSPKSLACANCHTQEVAEWRDSQHAWANRLVDARRDESAFTHDISIPDGPYTTTVHRFKSQPAFRWDEPGVDPVRYLAESVIGITPLRQYLVPGPGGRLQTMDVSFDPRSNEWYDAQADGRTPKDWGHWMNRGMNWNSQCAYCHMTGFEKNYDPRTDSYQSSWTEMGIGCAQCHGDLTAHAASGAPLSPAQRIQTNRLMAACYACHSRREELTGAFVPGEAFLDHFRPALADQPHLYQPDGQVRDENFEFTSFAMSRMHHAGVTCLDCHNPHSGGLRAPIENNALCLTCHAPPGRNGAIPVDPVLHSHHTPGTTGSRCVDCHMPEHTYMGRDARRDHWFSVPDPLLNKEHGIPDACTGCHADQGVDWTIRWVDTWYGAAMDRPQRLRARALARLRKGEADVVPEVIRIARAEEIVAWRAALVGSLGVWNDRADARAHLTEALADPDPLVRSAAVRALATARESYNLLKPLRMDPVRAVRIDAARATVNSLEYQQPSHRELVAFLQNCSDQPAGALQLSEKALAEDKMDDAIRWAEKAVSWDASSAAAHAWLGRLLTLAGNSEEAERLLIEACRLEPESSSHAYTLALLYGQVGKSEAAAEKLRRAVELDPGFGRAWYNLGLALAQMNQLTTAIEAMEKAESLMPESLDPPYARATIHLRAGQPEAALAAAQRAATINPDHAQTQELLRRLKN